MQLQPPMMHWGPERLFSILLHVQEATVRRVTNPIWLVSPSEFEPFGQITLGKCRRDAQLNNVTPIQVSRGSKLEVSLLGQPKSLVFSLYTIGTKTQKIKVTLNLGSQAFLASSATGQLCWQWCVQIFLVISMVYSLYAELNCRL